MSSITTSESARAFIHTEAALGAAGSNSTSPSRLRTASLGLCPKAESSPLAKACAMNRLRLASTRYRMAFASVQRAPYLASHDLGRQPVNEVRGDGGSVRRERILRRWF